MSNHIVEAVLNRKDLSQKDEKGRNALMLAVAEYPISDIKNILGIAVTYNKKKPRPPYIFETDVQSRTALFYAAERNDEDILWLLLNTVVGTGISNQRGALLGRKDVEGKTAEQFAEEMGNENIAEILSSERLRIEYFE